MPEGMAERRLKSVLMHLSPPSPALADGTRTSSSASIDDLTFLLCTGGLRSSSQLPLGQLPDSQPDAWPSQDVRLCGREDDREVCTATGTVAGSNVSLMAVDAPTPALEAHDLAATVRVVECAGGQPRCEGIDHADNSEMSNKLPNAMNEENMASGTSQRLHEFFGSLSTQDVRGLGTGKGMQAFRWAGNDASGTVSVSRNNAMTGHARFAAEDCIFCRIIQGRSPAYKIYEDDMCICILDLQPLSHGHSLIIPKVHFPSLELTPPEVAAAMCATVPHISMAIMEVTNCDSFNLLVNSGEAAGQVVFHTHFHIIPRKHNDNLWRSEGSARRPLPAGHETASLVQQICRKLSKSRHM